MSWEHYEKLVRAFFTIQIQDYFNGIRAYEIHKNKSPDKIKAYVEINEGHATKAYDWIRSKKNNSVFSFESVCKILEIDPGRMRRHLLAIAKPQDVHDVYSRQAAMEHFGVLSAKRMRAAEDDHSKKILGINDL